MGIKTEMKIIEGEKISIDDLLNREIVVTDAIQQKTKYGEDRWLIGCEVDGIRRKFFTGSKILIDQIKQIKAMEDGYPFKTVVKAVKLGNCKAYMFN